MPAELKERLRALSETILLDLDAGRMVTSTEIMMTMSRAAQSQRRVMMRYRSRQEEETQRGLDPYGLARYQGEWYVVGHCHLRNDLRSFRLDRVLDVKLTDGSFERPAHFDALAYLVKTMATIPRRFTFEVLLKADAGTAQEDGAEALGILEEGDDGLLLRGSIDNVDWLARQLARLSFDFVVREPEELRDALRKRAGELMDLAGAS
jgi:predicted DNA-binding transcriptional regulator YafY